MGDGATERRKRGLYVYRCPESSLSINGAYSSEYNTQTLRPNRMHISKMPLLSRALINGSSSEILNNNPNTGRAISIVRI